ncbi:N-acetyltransferase [Moritella sp. 24]|uniref:acyltransferase n=1 Tax=Moritella sp. 24 TaxID=2746230 RepID=UPI001BABDFEA|nr:acyltransferase [Moritella sp. 24]QUM77885.1 N-acetyltransferase [Moritella sp. 24]
MIHPSAIVSDKAEIQENVTIGPFCVIHENVIIKKGTQIGSYCEIGIATRLAITNTLIIGENSIIRSHSTIYIGSTIGKNFQTGHYVTIRENSAIGNYCQLGSRGDIQGDCSIGHYTKMHADVHIGKESQVGNYVWMFPEVLLTNDPTPPSDKLLGVTVEDFAVLAAKVLVLPGVNIGKDAVIAAGSIVKGNVLAGKVASGSPAKVICDAKILRLHNNPKIKAYPWRNRFHRGYSEVDVQRWISEIEEIKIK